jgi:hypothetical protein
LAFCSDPGNILNENTEQTKQVRLLPFYTGGNRGPTGKGHLAQGHMLVGGKKKNVPVTWKAPSFSSGPTFPSAPWVAHFVGAWLDGSLGFE